MAEEKELKYHGGQSWSTCRNFIQDFSVTTNALGTPESAKLAVADALDHMNHYPPTSQEPALSDTANFVWTSTEEARSNKGRILLGNGSSELIDLVIRYCALNGAETWRPGPTLVQYKDYERCARAAGMDVVKKNQTSKMMSMVNPTNPTGDFMRVNAIKEYIENNAADNSFVTVDESMIFWYGPDWREESLTNQSEWIDRMWADRGIKIFIIQSWTKIWSCCGLRIGSVITPHVDVSDSLRKLQTPWSVNTLALAFMSAALKDEEYLKSTWQNTKVWRAEFVKKAGEIFPEWTFAGAPFTSWIWVDTGSETFAKTVHDVCEAFGVPIRWARYGYKQPSCVRFGVRKPEYHARIFSALRMAKGIISGEEAATEWALEWLH